MTHENFKSKPYTKMTKDEVETIIIEEIKNMSSKGIKPTAQNYSIHRRADAPQYQTIRTLIKTSWKELVKKSGVQVPEREVTQRSWKETTDDEMLEIVLEAMSKLDSISFSNYQKNAADNAPSLPTVMNRLDCTWNELVEKYTEKYGKFSLKTKKNVQVPYDRYKELIAIEKAYTNLGGKSNE